MPFIILTTGTEKRQVYINSDRINYMQQLSDKTVICFGDNNKLEVYEDPAYIQSAINHPC